MTNFCIFKDVFLMVSDLNVLFLMVPVLRCLLYEAPNLQESEFHCQISYGYAEGTIGETQNTFGAPTFYQKNPSLKHSEYFYTN